MVYISCVLLREPQGAAAALMAPATSSAFLTTEMLHLLSLVQQSNVSLAFLFNFERKSVFWNFQHSPIYAGASANTAASLRHAILSSLIYVAVLSGMDCLYCCTHGFSKTLTTEEAPASIQMCCQLT